MSQEIPGAAAALSTVDVLRTEGATPMVMAEALLGLSQALDREERDDEAGAAVREGIETLTPSFLADPPPLAVPMRALLAQYISLAGRGGCDLDPFLLLPVAAELGALRETDAPAMTATAESGGSAETEHA